MISYFVEVKNNGMEFKLETANNITLVGDVYIPEGKTEKILLLIHGLGEHFGRYAHWCKRFTGTGIAVFGVDLPGHGRSPGKRGHVSSYHIFNDVIDSLALYARRKLGDLPLGIYGHSLGGSIVLNYLLTNTMGMKYSVVTSPWIKLSSPPSKLLLAVARAMNSILPGLTQPNGLKLEDLSHNADINLVYGEDLLVHNKISVRLANETIDAGRRILETQNNIEIPILLVHGSEDKITSPQASRDLAGRSDLIDLHIWEQGYHELHNEPFNNDVFKLISDWLEKQKP